MNERQMASELLQAAIDIVQDTNWQTTKRERLMAQKRAERDYAEAHPFEVYVWSRRCPKQFFGRFSSQEKAERVGREAVGTVARVDSYGTHRFTRYLVVDTRPATVVTDDASAAA